MERKAGRIDLHCWVTSLLSLLTFATVALLPGRADAACTFVGTGNNSVGQTNVPSGLDQVLLLTSGSAATAALKKDGSIAVWGNDFNGLVTGAPAGAGYKDVALSGTHGLAVTAAGDVVCWSTAGTNPCVGKPTFTDAVLVAAGSSSSYVVRADGTVSAWGESAFDAVTLAHGATNIARVVAGGQLAAGITKDGYVVTWATGFSTPETLGKVRTLAISNVAFYALTSAGLVTQWGLTSSEQMPTDLVDVVDIAAADGLVVASDWLGNVRAWGDGAGLLGDISSITNVSMFGVGPGFLIREDCGGFCGVRGSLGCCEGGTIKYCVDGNANSYDCPSTQCGWSTQVDAFDCQSSTNLPPNIKVRTWCGPDYACEPNCTGKACGDDGCGGACGTCGVDQFCNTLTGTCGEIGAGDTTGGADSSDTFDVPACVPDCAGRVCGFDGCGGSCGNCGSGEMCDVSGQCVAAGSCSPDNLDCRACICALDNFCCSDWDSVCASQCTMCTSCSTSCTPDCTGKVCGDDGCGGICGECGAGETCSSGQCVLGCVPNCNGKTCGDDGCGGSCGSCGGNQTCTAGQCVTNCTSNCSGKACGDDGCGGSCGTCASGNECVGGACTCTPKCAGKVCGDNGCGGTCGSCGSGETCNGEGQCIGPCTVKGMGNNAVGQINIPSTLDPKDIRAINSGSSAVVVLKKDGSLVAWGNDYNGLVSKLPSGTGYKDIAVSNVHGLALTNEGKVVCWGKSPGTACSVPSGLTDVVSIAAGEGSSYAVKSNGQVVAWGTSNFDSVKYANGATNIRRVYATNQFAVGVTTTGYAVSFANGYPVPATLGKVLTLAVAQYSMYAVKPNGKVVRWGIDGSFALSENVPADVGDVVDLVSSQGLTAALMSNGAVRVWGQSSAQVADTSGIKGATTVAVGPNFLIYKSCPGSCGAISDTGCCEGGEAKVCTNGAIQTSTCGSGCGWSSGNDAFTCGGTGTASPKVRNWCKADVTCTPNCTGKNCGDDGCGGVCGACASDKVCSTAGQCVCQPNCAGKTCGDNGCGGSCGLCPGGTACDAGTSQCKCVPKCDGKTCGDDGCGGSCGTCGAGKACGPGNTCQNICVPNCSGKSCGSDGCGGTCGTCGPATGPGVYFCHNATGTCRHFKCPDLPKEGCCDGETAKYCGLGGVVVTKSCTGENKYCGWEPSSASTTVEYSSYMCTATASSVKAGVARACPGTSQCVPNCTGKTCGSDGCGGSCGTCASYQACEFGTGTCKATDCPPCAAGEFCNKTTKQCQKSACADVPYEGCCKDSTFVGCNQTTGKPTFQTCKSATSTTPQACGWNGANFACMNPADVKTTPVGKVKDCSAKVCVPQCSGKTCGDDGCGGTCGTCTGSATCQAGVCKAPCVPSCDRISYNTKECNYDDGCGGTCGCPSGSFCDTYNNDPTDYCKVGVDECKALGIDFSGCCASGTQYKWCGSGKLYTTTCDGGDGGCNWHMYVKRYICGFGNAFTSKDPSGTHPKECPGTITCTPNCSNKTCGDNGCGGSCGTCGAGERCDTINQKCIAQCDNEVGFQGCCDGDTMKTCGKMYYYSSSTVHQYKCDPGTCGWDAANSRYACNTSGGSDPSGKYKKACKCIPNCNAKSCGPDGCGGTCGTCGSGAICLDKAAQGGYGMACCTPQCSGKTCGPDGCGGTCGSCTSGNECDTGQCVPIPPAPDCTNTKWQGSCNGNVLQFCSGGTTIVKQDCTATGQNACGWNAQLGAYSCGTNGKADPSNVYPKAAAGTKALCVPDCGGKQCGSDGCGGFCGFCNAEGGYCNQTKGTCYMNTWEFDYTFVNNNICSKQPGTRPDPKNGNCGTYNNNSCNGYCGQFLPASTCQCDSYCTARGDCCTDYTSTCGGGTAAPAYTPGKSTCGTGGCQASLGETCSTCPGDCGDCNFPAAGSSPPWLSPFPELLGLPGTTAQHAYAASTGIDSLTPADSPYPREDLVAYSPGSGAVYGRPLTRVLNGLIKAGGTFSSVAGALGNALRFGNGSSATFGLQRIQFHDSVPADPAIGSENPGGLTLAMWIKVPTTAPNTTNGLATLRMLENSVPYGAPAHTIAGRPGDLNLDIACKQEYPSIEAKVTSVFAWYGLPAAPLKPGSGAGAAFEGSKPGACQVPSIQATAETACLGKKNCTLTAPAVPACATGATVAPQLYARYTCAYSSEQYSHVFAVQPSSDNSRLRFGRGNDFSVFTKESVKDGQWHHVAVTFRPFNGGGWSGLTSLYLDGELQDSSTKLTYTQYQEFVLGGARIYDSADTSIVNEYVPAVADLDEVFVYRRPLSDTQVRQLKNKRDLGVLRQWPVLTGKDTIATGSGIGKGATVSTATVSADRVRTRGSYGNGAPIAMLPAGWDGLNVTAGKFEQSVDDSDLTELKEWTFAGWVQLGTGASASQELVRVMRGTSEQLTISRGANCGGQGLAVGFPSGPYLQTANCDHVLGNGTWHFVAVVQRTGSRWLYLDGSRLSFAVSDSALNMLNGTGAVTVSSPAGAVLGWTALYGRPLSTDEMEVLRNPGPVAWFDAGRYQEDGQTKARDYANFHNRTSSTATTKPQFRNPVGDPLPSGAPQNTAVLTMSAFGDNNLGDILIPTNGRLAGNNAELLRPFSFSTRVRVAAGDRNYELLKQFSTTTANATGYAVTGRLFSRLSCNFTQFSNNLSCSVFVKIREDDYYTYEYQSEVRTVKSSIYPTEVDVAVSWDGKKVRAAIGGADVDFGTSAVPGTGTTSDAPKSSLLTFTRTGPVGIITNLNPQKAPVGSFYLLTSSDSKTYSSELRYFKLWGRSLSNPELLSQAEGNCAALKCGDQERSCVDSTSNGGGAVCSECYSTSFESGGEPGTSCYTRKSWGAHCVTNAECASDYCNQNVCTAKTVDAACTAACRARGKACKVMYEGASWAYTDCDTQCLPHFGHADEWASTSADCIWMPTAETGELCDSNDHCKSGGCSSVSDYVYNFSVDRDPACLSDGTCPGWYNTSDGNKPFKCNKKYGMQVGDTDVCMWNPKGKTGIQSVKRCDSTSTVACSEIHRQSLVTSKSGPLGDTLYKCGECESGTYTGSDNVTRPLWVKRWRFLSPEACTTMHANLVRAWVGGRYADVPSLLWEQPTAASLGQFILEKPRGSVVTPKEFASMINMGVGPDLVDYVLDDEVNAEWTKKFGYFYLADCATDIKSDKKSPFTDPNTNYMICAPNQFPDGTPCPPPGIDAKLADQFCQSGFCARDTGVCEEGYGRLEETDSASRRDQKQGESPAVGGMDFTQKNTTTLEFKKVKDAAKANTDKQSRTYSLNAATANTLTFFGATLDVMAIKNTMSGVLDGSKAASYTPSVVIFGISQPQSSGPPLKCPGMSWENGALKNDPSKSKNCEAVSPAKISVPLPTVKLCTPAPGGCEDDKANSPFKTVQKGSGPLCVKRFVFVGPVPVSIEAGVVIEACLGYGATVDPESYEGAFEIRPEIGVSVEVQGGVGGDIFIVEVFIGIKAALTIVNLAFPIKWAMTVAAGTDSSDNPVSNMWILKYARTVNAELNVLKLALSAVVEAGVAIFKAEWEYVFYEFEGLTFSWELSNEDIFSKKIDLQHKTANQ